jgi:hypothetical protein
LADDCLEIKVKGTYKHPDGTEEIVNGDAFIVQYLDSFDKSNCHTRFLNHAKLLKTSVIADKKERVSNAKYKARLKFTEYGYLKCVAHCFYDNEGMI